MEGAGCNDTGKGDYRTWKEGLIQLSKYQNCLFYFSSSIVLTSNVAAIFQTKTKPKNENDASSSMDRR
jgi:hypothetical protein